jgi:hypothetical protein
MALWTRARDIVASAEATGHEVRARALTYPVGSANIRPLSIPAWPHAAPLDVAMRVPAFRRGVELIASTVSTFPLVEHPADDVLAAIPRGRRLFRQPEPDRPYAATMRDTVVDLIAYGKAYWEILTRDGDGWPDQVRYWPADTVSELAPGDYLVNGEPAADAVITFTYGRPVLIDGADTLALAGALEQAAKRYAETPLPSFALKNGGADLPADKVEELLDAWEAARQVRATAYLSGGLEAMSFGYNAQELQLVEARQSAALEIGRLLNLDPVWIGAGVPGSSMTYQNRVDLYRQLLDTTLSPLMSAIEQRLSYSRPRTAGRSHIYPAVTEETRRVAFDADRYLQANYTDRVATMTQLYAAGLVDRDEARRLLDITPLEGPAV